MPEESRRPAFVTGAWPTDVYTTFQQPMTGSRNLICLPYAGGNANVYRPWVGQLPEVDVVAARLPGRGDRFNEPFETRFPRLVTQLAEGIRPYTDVPFALFGHSMGGLMAYELARAMESAGAGPRLLIVSAVESPCAPGTKNPDSAASSPDESDEALLEQLIGQGSVPVDMLAEPELVDIWLRILRADMQLTADYAFDHTAPRLSAPTYVYYGEDECMDPAGLRRAWEQAVSGPLALRGFPGGHLFIRDAWESVRKQLARDIDDWVAFDDIARHGD